MKNILLFIVMVLLTLSSCKKFLDKKNNNSIAVPEKLEDLQALLDDQGYMNSGVTPSLAECFADDYFHTETSYNNLAPEYKLIYTWQKFPSTFPNDWSVCYKIVYNANLCLDLLEEIGRTQENATQWDNIKGQALFARANAFLNLVWVYCKGYDVNTAQKDKGIVLRTSSDFNTTFSRSNLADSYSKIIEDAKEALKYLPSLTLVQTRGSKAAADGLLARAYLSMQLYDSSFKYSDVSLHVYDSLMDYNKPEDGININANTTFWANRFTKEVVFYTDLNSLRNIHTAGAIDSSLYSSYDINDLRRTAFFLPYKQYYRFKGGYARNYRLFSGIATDELFLIRAESAARTGNIEGAMADLNHLLQKRWNNKVVFIPLVAATREDALALILEHRRKELLFRGLRWSDIKRLNRAGYNILLKRVIGNNTYTLEPNSDAYDIALPDDLDIK